MTAFMPIAPMKAVEFVEAAGIAEGKRVLTDYAAADLLKSYARIIETIKPNGDRVVSRGSAIPADLWHQMISEGVVEDVWPGGTVRLATASAGGQLRVNITGIGFGEKQLRALVAQHRGVVATERSAPRTVASRTEVAKDVERVEPVASVPVRKRQQFALAAVKPNPTLVNVKEAMAMLGLGRTKINEMMKDGRLVRYKIDGATRIEVGSIMALTER